MKDNWFTGSGDPISFSDLMDRIDGYILEGGRVFIGTDSQIKSDQCIFVTAICLHGKLDKNYASYFFNRRRLKRKPYQVLKVRIMEEVQHSLEIAIDLMEKYPESEIEVHVDVGRTQRSATRHFADAISGWIKGVGLACKMKPDSWASSSVADSHTK